MKQKQIKVKSSVLSTGIAASVNGFWTSMRPAHTQYPAADNPDSWVLTDGDGYELCSKVGNWRVFKP